MNVSRWSLPIAWTHALELSAVDPENGHQRARTLRHKILSGFAAFTHVLNPSAVIVGMPGASGCLTSIRGARLNMAAWVVAVVGCVTLVVVPAPACWSPIAVLGVATGVIAFGSLWKPVASTRHLPGPATHVLTDMVRHTSAPAGVGSRLLSQLTSEDQRTIIGIAHNERLWEKVYAAHSTKVGAPNAGAQGFRVNNM